MHWTHIWESLGKHWRSCHSTPSGCRGASCEVLTTTIGQQASILQCLDRPIENALGLVKIGVRPPITLHSDGGGSDACLLSIKQTNIAKLRSIFEIQIMHVWKLLVRTLWEACPTGCECTMHIHGLTSMSHFVKFRSSRFDSFCRVCYKT